MSLAGWGHEETWSDPPLFIRACIHVFVETDHLQDIAVRCRRVNDTALQVDGTEAE